MSLGGGQAHQTGDLLHNRYRIVRQLAQGGFGTLYRAWDTALARPCVLKENLAASQDGQRQFLREAKILANLNHPNLPRVSDYFLVQGRGQYLIMDYVEGQDLQQMLEDRGGPFPEDKVIAWAGQICDALDYLHAQSPPVIHRDIKPANIRITPNGHAVLIDFGIAKVYEPHLKTTLGAQAVSPGYSPYEQYGKGKTDPRTDIYALGATLYTLLTGQEPAESVQRVVKDPLVPARQLNRNLSLRTSAALMRAMQMDASQRFQTASELKKALTPPPPIQVPSPVIAPYQAPVQPISNTSTQIILPWGWIGLVGLLILIILILLWQILNYDRIPGLAIGPDPQSTLAGFLPSQTIAMQTATPTYLQASATAATLSPSLTPLVYTVQSGDTCSEIAEAYGVSVKQIVSQNPDLTPDCGVLYSGQVLLIPQADGPIDAPVMIRSPTAPVALVTQVSTIDGMRLVYIPAGEFSMGASEDDLEAGDSERPIHEVYLSAYWIDQNEVTNGMYNRCVQAGACQPPGERGSKTRTSYFGDAAFDLFPVIHVSWEDAADYCGWAGRRLPSEAEWEKAARGTDGRLYPWGNSPPGIRLANFDNLLGDTEQAAVHPAGASPYGVLDMAGNVSEWVADWFQANAYLESLYKNPVGPSDGEFRLIRGGSWFHPARSLRASSRLWNYPDLQSDTLGFRCAK